MKSSQASELLKNLLSFHLFDKKIATLEVLVVCVGIFPSFFTLRKILYENLPKLQRIDFTLIEPATFKTDYFLKKVAGEIKDATFNIQNTTLENFLRNTNKKFDLIYFEHPDLRTMIIILAHCFKFFKNTVGLRASIAHLFSVCKENTGIIASNMSEHENQQLKYLLKYYYDAESKLIKLNHKTGAYTHGLYAQIASESKSHKRTNDGYLTIFTIFFMVSYGYMFLHARSLLNVILPLFLLFIAFQYHRPGKKWLMVLGFLQITMMVICYALPHVLVFF
jgi:hypothetical protein